MVTLNTLGHDNGFPKNPKRPKVYCEFPSFRKGCADSEVLDSRFGDSGVLDSRLNNTPRTYPPRRNLKGFPVNRDFPAGCGGNQRILKVFPIKRDFPVGCGGNQKGFPRKGDCPVRCKIQSLDNSFHFNDQNKPIIEVVKPLEVYNGLGNSDREKVKKTLNLFREVVSVLMQEQEHEHAGKSGIHKILFKAAKLLKDEKRWINTPKRLGSIPGVEVGDKFQWRFEMTIIGLHQQFNNGIDYMEEGGKLLATSIVESGRYTNDGGYCDHLLIYSGHGGNPKVSKDAVPEDQKLIQGNLALKNSMEAKTPVRVIRGIKNLVSSNSSTIASVMKKNNVVYVYDGLYFVERYWQARGPFGNLVFKFLLRSLGQKDYRLDEMREEQSKSMIKNKPLMWERENIIPCNNMLVG